MAVFASAVFDTELPGDYLFASWCCGGPVGFQQVDLMKSTMASLLLASFAPFIIHVSFTLINVETLHVLTHAIL